jgi:hypothetical protein
MGNCLCETVSECEVRSFGKHFCAYYAYQLLRKGTFLGSLGSATYYISPDWWSAEMIISRGKIQVAGEKSSQCRLPHYKSPLASIVSYFALVLRKVCRLFIIIIGGVGLSP